MRIAVIAGGTGGHVCPAWVLAQALQDQGHHVVFYTDPRGMAYLPVDRNKQIDIQALPLTAPSQGTIKFIWSLLCTFIKLLKPFRKDQRPQKAVGFGGYPLLAWGLIALTKRIPLIIHEQNALPGRVNRLLARWAQEVAITFPTPRLGSRAILTGLPLRKDFTAVPYVPAFGHTPFRLFVIGGSQGAYFFHKILPPAVALLPTALQQRLHIVHQCPAAAIPVAQTAYEQTIVHVELKPYFEDVSLQLAQAHLVISRAGASTLVEIVTVGRPALLIPFPQSMDDHQTVNARLMEAQGGVWCQPEKNLTVEDLALFLQKALTSPGLLASAADSFEKRAPAQTLDKLMGLVLK